MIIDIHNHPDWHGHNCRKCVENMDQYGIDITWILSWESPGDEYDPTVLGVTGSDGPATLSQCVSYVEKAPSRFILGYCPDIRKPEAIDRMNAAITIYGAKVCGELKLRMMYDNRDAIRFFRFCGEKNIPVLVHIDYEFPTNSVYPRPNYWYGGGIEAFERAIRQCPETIFIGHAPGFWAHISGDDLYDKQIYPTGKVQPGGKLIQMLKEYRNLYCDLSAGSGLNALKRDPKFAKGFITEYQDRLLYGRDYFDNLHQEFINSLGLPKSVLNKIYADNALKLVAI